MCCYTCNSIHLLSLIQQAAANRERVEWRAAEYAWKCDKLKEARAAAEAEAAAREERLARLRALVAPVVSVARK